MQAANGQSVPTDRAGKGDTHDPATALRPGVRRAEGDDMTDPKPMTQEEYAAEFAFMMDQLRADGMVDGIDLNGSAAPIEGTILFMGQTIMGPSHGFDLDPVGKWVAPKWGEPPFHAPKAKPGSKDRSQIKAARKQKAKRK